MISLTYAFLKLTLGLKRNQTCRKRSPENNAPFPIILTLEYSLSTQSNFNNSSKQSCIVHKENYQKNQVIYKKSFKMIETCILKAKTCNIRSKYYVNHAGCIHAPILPYK